MPGILEPLDKSTAQYIAEAVAAERERCARLVPTNWCDPLLTGPGAPKHPWSAVAVGVAWLAIIGPCDDGYFWVEVFVPLWMRRSTQVEAQANG